MVVLIRARESKVLATGLQQLRHRGTNHVASPDDLDVPKAYNLWKRYTNSFGVQCGLIQSALLRRASSPSMPQLLGTLESLPSHTAGL
jgi:hypothetical protein